VSAIRVALVDDQALFRAGVRMLVESQPDLVFAGDAADGRAAIALAERSRPDVILMDVRMPHLDGIAATERILADADRDGREPPRIIVLTTFDLDENAARAIRAGASGFVLKDADPDELVRAVRVVADGGSLLSPSVTRRVIERFAVPAPGRAAPSGTAAQDRAVQGWSAPGWAVPHPALDRLTGREREIVAWVATGRSNDQIAAELVVSPATVRTHVGRAMVKLGARDRVQLVIIAIQSGLAPLS
jgi:DNA-binding NarL/FixJ family response regulator